MDKRYQVFVSSTYTDLMEERSQIIQALLNLDCIPAGMEMFPAADEDQWSLIKRVIDESDYYLVVVGGRYGSLSEAGISYTEREYDYAVESNTPVLGFVHGDPDMIPSGKTDQDSQAREKLDAFRKKVELKMIKKFNTPAELGGVVTTSLVRIFKDRPAEGWVRGRHAMTPETATEIAQLREQLAAAEVERLKSGRTVDGDTDEFKQGVDTVEIHFNVVSNAYYDGTNVDAVALLSWDEVLREVGPSMIDEASEGAIKDRLGVHLLARAELKPDNRSEFINAENPDVSIYIDSWEKIVVQLRAAGLIDKGAKKRQIRDTATYFCLTDKGDRHLVRLLAERR